MNMARKIGMTLSLGVLMAILGVQNAEAQRGGGGGRAKASGHRAASAPKARGGTGPAISRPQTKPAASGLAGNRPGNSGPQLSRPGGSAEAQPAATPSGRQAQPAATPSGRQAQPAATPDGQQAQPANESTQCSRRSSAAPKARRHPAGSWCLVQTTQRFSWQQVARRRPRCRG